MSIDVLAVGPAVHVMAVAGSSSIVCCEVPSGSVRQRRVSGSVPFHCWLTGLGTVGVGPGAVSHSVQ